VVSELVKRFDCRVVLVGGDDARREADHVHDVVSAVDLVGRTSVGQMAEVLRRSDLLIGNDSGPVHVAAAVGTASVVVSAHPVDGFPWVVNSPMRYHPWRAEHSVVRPGRRIEGCVDSPTCTEGVPHCVLSVDVDEVIEASVALLGPTLPTGREGDRS
jgi:ADP-heptose:LPS heptosyltransferase